jgi:hypothetical protein
MAGLFNFNPNAGIFGQSFADRRQQRQQNRGLMPGQGLQRLLGGLATGFIPQMLRGTQGLYAQNNQDLFSATTAPTVPSLQQQFGAMTGGMAAPMNANLGAVTRDTQPGLLNSQQQEVADAILGQFGMTSAQGYNATDYLTNGQLDLTKMQPWMLQGLSAQDRDRMRNSNVLGASLLTSMLPYSPPLAQAGTVPAQPRPAASKRQPPRKGGR